MLAERSTPGSAKPLRQAQKSFSSALLKPDLPVPEDVMGPTAQKKASKRFGVYRNNVIVSLTESMMAGFPTILALLGEDYFRALARVFISANPPSSPMLVTYGQDFGDFLDRFEPLAELAYLGDVARLEFAWQTAYHAADHASLDPAQLQTVSPEQLGALTFTMHPSLHLLRCSHAAYSIWAAHQQEDPAAAMANFVDQPQDILITRPQWDVTVVLMPSGGFEFATALSKGRSLGEAAEEASQHHDDFDFAQNLGGLIETGALIAFNLPEN